VEAKASAGAVLHRGGGGRGGGGWGDCRRSPAGRRMSSTGGSSGADLKICWGQQGRACVED
jgi:hypothetical protein